MARMHGGTWVPTQGETTNLIRRVYNGIKSEYLCALIEEAVRIALNDPQFQTRMGTLGVQNLETIHED